MTFKRLIVSIQCRFQLTAFGQGVTPIVVGVGVGALGKPLGGATVVAGFIERHTPPLRIFEMLRGLGRALLFEQVQALLIGTQPQVFEVEGVTRLWQQEQQWQAEQPTPAPGTGGQ